MWSALGIGALGDVLIYWLLFIWKRESACMHWFFPSANTHWDWTWLIHVSCMQGRDPSPWAIACPHLLPSVCLLRNPGSETEAGLQARCSEVGHWHPSGFLTVPSAWPRSQLLQWVLSVCTMFPGLLITWLASFLHNEFFPSVCLCLLVPIFLFLPFEYL